MHRVVEITCKRYLISIWFGRFLLWAPISNVSTCGYHRPFSFKRAPISLYVATSFDEKIFCLKSYQNVEGEILFMSRQICCRGLCKATTFVLFVARIVSSVGKIFSEIDLKF